MLMPMLWNHASSLLILPTSLLKRRLKGRLRSHPIPSVPYPDQGRDPGSRPYCTRVEILLPRAAARDTRDMALVPIVLPLKQWPWLLLENTTPTSGPSHLPSKETPQTQETSTGHTHRPSATKPSPDHLPSNFSTLEAQYLGRKGLLELSTAGGWRGELAGFSQKTSVLFHCLALPVAPPLWIGPSRISRGLERQQAVCSGRGEARRAEENCGCWLWMAVCFGRGEASRRKVLLTVDGWIHGNGSLAPLSDYKAVIMSEG